MLGRLFPNEYKEALKEELKRKDEETQRALDYYDFNMRFDVKFNERIMPLLRDVYDRISKLEDKQ